MCIQAADVVPDSAKVKEDAILEVSSMVTAIIEDIMVIIKDIMDTHAILSDTEIDIMDITTEDITTTGDMIFLTRGRYY